MDHPQLRNSPDRHRIHLGEEHEVRYWCATFNVTREELEKAVGLAGPVVDDVLRYFGRKKGSGEKLERSLPMKRRGFTGPSPCQSAHPLPTAPRTQSATRPTPTT